jgi:hypothetical protein
LEFWLENKTSGNPVDEFFRAFLTVSKQDLGMFWRSPEKKTIFAPVHLIANNSCNFPQSL